MNLRRHARLAMTTLGRLGICIPTLAVAAAAAALWLLWPEPSVVTAPVRRAGQVRFVGRLKTADHLYRSPVLFGRSSKIGFTVPEPKEDLARRVTPERNEMPALLEWDPAFVAPPAATVVPVKPVSEAVSYRPSLPDTGGFEVTRDGIPHVLRTRLSPSLSSRDWECAALAQQVAAFTSQVWRVRAFVTLDDTGRASHVFLEESSGRRDIDVAVVRALHYGCGSIGNGPGSGYIDVVSQGRS